MISHSSNSQDIKSELTTLCFPAFEVGKKREEKEKKRKETTCGIAYHSTDCSPFNSKSKSQAQIYSMINFATKNNRNPHIFLCAALPGILYVSKIVRF